MRPPGAVQNVYNRNIFFTWLYLVTVAQTVGLGFFHGPVKASE